MIVEKTICFSLILSVVGDVKGKCNISDKRGRNSNKLMNITEYFFHISPLWVCNIYVIRI